MACDDKTMRPRTAIGLLTTKNEFPRKMQLISRVGPIDCFSACLYPSIRSFLMIQEAKSQNPVHQRRTTAELTRRDET